MKKMEAIWTVSKWMRFQTLTETLHVGAAGVLRLLFSTLNVMCEKMLLLFLDRPRDGATASNSKVRFFFFPVWTPAKSFSVTSHQPFRGFYIHHLLHKQICVSCNQNALFYLENSGCGGFKTQRKLYFLWGEKPNRDYKSGHVWVTVALSRPTLCRFESRKMLII